MTRHKASARAHVIFFITPSLTMAVPARWAITGNLRQPFTNVTDHRELGKHRRCASSIGRFANRVVSPRFLPTRLTEQSLYRKVAWTGNAPTGLASENRDRSESGVLVPCDKLPRPRPF